MSLGVASVVVAAIAVGTYLMRAGLILVLADRQLPIGVQRALRNVAPAVLAALTVSLLAGGEGDGVEIELAEVVGLVVAGVVARWRRDLVLTLVAGMAALLVTAAIVG